MVSPVDKRNRPARAIGPDRRAAGPRLGYDAELSLALRVQHRRVEDRRAEVGDVVGDGVADCHARTRRGAGRGEGTEERGRVGGLRVPALNERVGVESGHVEQVVINW